MSTSHAPRDRRSLRAAIIAAAVLVFAYPLAANLFLGFGGVQEIFESTDSVKVDFKSAWSFWPGHVHVNDIRVTMQDRNVQFVLDIPQADVDVALRDLAHRTFHATRVRGEGLVFRFRHRIEPEAKDLPSVAAFPRIPGFSDPPLRETGPRSPPIDDAHYNLWTVHIEDVDVGVREVWAQMFRYHGVARAAGAFRLRPARRLWVGPAELRMQSGTISSGPSQAVSAVEGTLRCAVDDFDVEAAQGMAVFRNISAGVDARSTVPNLDVVNYLAGPSPKVSFADGSGVVDVHTAIDHGVFTKESRIEYRTSHVGVAAGPAKFNLDGDLVVSATGADQGGPAQVVLRMPTGRLAWEGAPDTPIELRGVDASMGTTSTDTTEPWSFAGARANLAASLSDATTSNGSPSGATPVEVKRGAADAEAWLTISPDEHMQGAVRGTAKEVKVCDDRGMCSAAPALELFGDLAGDLHGHAEGQVGVDARQVDLDFAGTRVAARTLRARANLTADDVRAKLDFTGIRVSARAACPWIEADRASIEGRVLTPSTGPITATAKATLGTASYTWGSFRAASARTNVTTTWNGQVLAGRIDSSPLDLTSSGGAPKGWQADVGSTSIRTDLRFRGGAIEGPVTLDAQRITSRIGNTEARGDVAVRAVIASQDKSYRIADVSGVVQARRVAFRTSQNTFDDWWGDLQFNRLHIDTRQNLDLTGDVSAKFKSAMPALYALAAQDQIPKWSPYLVPLGSLSLRVNVERYCHWTDIQLLGASSGPFTASGRVQVKPGDTQGAVLLQLAGLAPIALGLHFGEDNSDTALFAGRGWLEQHVAPLSEAATHRHDTRCAPEAPVCK